MTSSTKNLNVESPTIPMSFDFEKTVWLVIYILEGAIIIFGNIIGILIFTKKARRFRPCLLVANQCIADALVGLEICFHSFIYYLEHAGVSMYQQATSAVRGTHQCANMVLLVNSALWVLVFGESVISLTLIALERAYAVFRPFKHRVLRKKTYFYSITSSWVFTITFSLTYVLIHCYQVTKELSDFLYGLAFTISLCVVFALIISYTTIYIKRKFFTIFPDTAHARHELRLCRTFLCATLASFVTCSHFIFVQVYLRMNCFKNSLCLPKYIDDTAKAILFSNSFVNFFIYALKFPGFCECFKKLLCCRNAAINRIEEINMAG